MADYISKKLDKKVKQMAVGNVLGNISVQINKLKDTLRKKDKQKAAAGLNKGGRINKGLGGSTTQQHYLQHGYGPTKIKLKSGKPKLAIKGWK